MLRDSWRLYCTIRNSNSSSITAGWGLSNQSVSGCVLFQPAPQLPGNRRSFPQATRSRYPWLVIHRVQKHEQRLLANCFWVITATLQLFKNTLHNSHTVNLAICVSQKHRNITKRLAKKKMGRKTGGFVETTLELVGHVTPALCRGLPASTLLSGF